MMVVVFPLLGMLVLLLMTAGMVEGHGMMLDPPQRSSVWRDERFPGALVNTDDSALYCGGFDVMYSKNGGKCGICGDAFNEPHPRPNEAGGMYGQGFIVRNYKQGDVIHVTVRITANHQGHFIFKLCPNNNVEREVTQACLDKHRLKVLRTGADGRHIIDDRFPVRHHMYGDTDIMVKLPNDVTCSQCVLQWTYVTGHFWGCDSDGQCGIGLGDQEQFVNCADVAIEPSGHTTTKVHLSSFDPITKSYPVQKVTSRVHAVSAEIDVFWYATTSTPDARRSSSEVNTTPPDVSATRDVSRTSSASTSYLAYVSTTPPVFKTASEGSVNNVKGTYRDISKYFFDEKSTSPNDIKQRFFDVRTSSDATKRFLDVRTSADVNKRFFDVRASIDVTAASSSVIIPAWLRSTMSSAAANTEKSTAATPMYTGDGTACRSVGAYAGQTKVDVWCRVQCAVGYCPATHCTCGFA